MVNTLVALLVSFVLAILMVYTPSFIEAAGGNSGFGIELIHRESPLSPFYNHSETASDRFRKSVLRSMSRVNRFSRLTSTNLDTNIESQVIPNNGDYLMKLSIGTPPIELLAVADTGSDLTWTQCQPCEDCYKQDLPIFDPKTSSTYRETSCDSSPCQSLSKSKCDQNNACQYSYSYGDRSQTNGLLATETFTFDSTDENQRNVMIPTLVFGCGRENTGMFTSRGSGLVGLGGGPLSLVSQLGSKIDGKFSYCLVDLFENFSSKLNFGSQAIISGNNAVSTPIVTKDTVTFYYLTLEGVSVGGKRLENRPMSTSFGAGNEGNIVIDSGTTLTLLATELYNQLESAVREAIPLEPIQDTNGTLKLCYSAQSEIQVPEMIFHFTGADVCLTRLNTFAKVSDDLQCLTMAPTQSFPIYGNLAQMNFLVEYDLVGRKVSFAPADCTEY